MLRRIMILLPYFLSFYTSASLMTLELVASRLVARHVGGSLLVWTSVIGVILAGICLGNVLGGRLADRVPPREVLGPLYAVGAALTVAILWLNSVVGLLPGLSLLPWDLRTLVVVTLDFLIPATVLGMISPVVAKIAVDDARKTGSAIGDVYFLGAVGSIVGTFLTGFYFIYLAPTSTIVAIVAASLAFLAMLLGHGRLFQAAGIGAFALLMAGVANSLAGGVSGGSADGGAVRWNALMMAGHLAAMVLGGVGLLGLRRLLGQNAAPSMTKLGAVSAAVPAPTEAAVTKARLADLSALAFIASLAFMALEMVAGRLVSRHLGSSIYGWTSVIGVLLGGLSIGNYLGGKLADRIRASQQAASLFLVASILVLSIILMETPPEWLVRNPIAYLFGGAPPEPLAGGEGEFLGQAVSMTGFPWWFRVLFWTSVVFLVPSIAMGTVSPVVAKLAVERLRQEQRTGTAIGTVYAWGMVGSIAGTFLAGFLLIDLLGTKGLVLAISCLMALSATGLGSIWHAAWAGIPLGLCIIAFLPALLPGPTKVDLGQSVSPVVRAKTFLTNVSTNWGLREQIADPSDPDAEISYLDESNYYFIKVNNDRAEGRTTRTLVLDNLIHGYFILGQPERLDYDYEHIYALVTHRARQSQRDGANEPQEFGTLFLGGGSYTFPRYLQAKYPRTWAEVAEIDPAVTRANHVALGLPWSEPTLPAPRVEAGSGQEVVTIQRETIVLGEPSSEQSAANYLKALESIAPPLLRDEATNTDYVVIDGTRRLLGPHGAPGSRQRYLETIKDWLENSKYRIRTTWGDARQYVVKNQSRMKFDVIYGDAFNDFSVPWHLTTLEFNQLLDSMLAENGIYMINIIDVYESDAHAARFGPERALQGVLEGVLQGRWDGVRSRSELAADLVSMLARPERNGAWRALGGIAERALGENAQARSRLEIAAALKAQAKQEAILKASVTGGGALLQAPRERDDLEAMARQALGIARNDDLVRLWRDLDREFTTRWKRQRTEPTTIQGVGLAIQMLGPSSSSLSSWEIEAGRLLDRLSQATRALGTLRVEGNETLSETLDRAQNETMQLYEKNEINNATARVALEVFSSATRAFGMEAAPGEPGSFQDAARQEAVIEAVGRVKEQIERLRVELSSRVLALREKAKADEAQAVELARVGRAALEDREAWVGQAASAIVQARKMGGFLGAWVNTASRTFPHVYVFGTDQERGNGVRETFVVVASHRPLDLEDLGRREGDPRFFHKERFTEPRPFSATDMRAILLRSRGIVLTDDYAPVENLLAPVAATRGD